METYDVIVLGGGSGGCAAAIRAADLGKKVALVEKRKKDGIGGTCINRGCIPAKALLKSADLYAAMKTAGRFGVRTGEVAYDLKAIMKRKDSLVKTMRFGLENYLLKPRSVTVFQGFGKCLDARTVEVSGPDGSRILKGEALVLALGSEPADIPVFNIDHETILTSDDLLSLETLPETALVVGGGAVGIEFAAFMAALDVKVTLVELLPHVAAALEDEDMSAIVENALRKKGIRILTGRGIKKMEASEGEAVALLDNGEEIRTGLALISIGRRLNTEEAGLEALGLEREGGRLKVDGRMRTSVPGVYAVGDIVPGPQLSHKAQREGIVAAEALAGLDTVMDYDVVPWAIFSKPEIASVGLSERQAAERGYDPLVGFLPFAANEKANTMQEIEGAVKVVADGESNRILGARIVGPEASVLIGELALAVKSGTAMDELACLVHAHPTLSECVMEACKAGMGKAFHKSMKPQNKRR